MMNPQVVKPFLGSCFPNAFAVVKLRSGRGWRFVVCSEATLIDWLHWLSFSDYGVWPAVKEFAMCEACEQTMRNASRCTGSHNLMEFALKAVLDRGHAERYGRDLFVEEKIVTK